MTTQLPTDFVLDVAPEDQRAYARNSYRDYLRVWNERVQELEHARRSGDLELAARLAEELRHIWPQPDAVAEAAWIPAPERQQPLPSDSGL